MQWKYVIHAKNCIKTSKCHSWQPKWQNLFYSTQIHPFQIKTQITYIVPASQAKFCSTPMPALGIVPDGVVSPHPDPVRNRPVLPHLLGQLLLDAKSLVWRHFRCFHSAPRCFELVRQTVNETLIQRNKIGPLNPRRIFWIFRVRKTLGFYFRSS